MLAGRLTSLGPCRTALVWLSLLVGSPATALARKSEVRADVVQPGEDFSAHRIDSEVVGWSTDYKEVAAVGSNVTRGRQGEHRGETFLLVFDVGSLTAKENVQLHFLTQAALPHDPIPLDPIGNWLWTLTDNPDYMRMWPKRPRKRRPTGAMQITPLWEIGELGEGLCQPLLGFALEWRKQRRYQLHQPLPVRASCERMRYTDHRVAWGKKDLAALMIRFDHGAPKNEQSVRFVVSASWELARPLHANLKGPGRRDGAMTAAAKELATLGEVHREPGPDGTSWRIRYQPELAYLGKRLAALLEGYTDPQPPPAGIDLEVERADPVASAPARPPTASDRAQGPPDEPECGGLLRDCDR